MSTHFDAEGSARMVDISAKQVTERVATASGSIWMSTQAATMVREGTAQKGDVLAVARLAAISGSKWTSHLIPLCHAIPIEGVTIEFEWAKPRSISGSIVADSTATDRQQLCCRATVRTSGKTGVEMEALTAVSVATLTVYDMLKSVDRQMTITSIQLEAKSGGKSGDFRRSDASNPVA